MNPLVNGLFRTFKTAQDLDGLKDDDAFELFSANLALADEVLIGSELSGLLLDKSVLGMDIALIDINGQIVRDADDVDDVASDASRLDVSITFIQAKQSDGVSSTQILNFGDAVQSFLLLERFEEWPVLNSLVDALRRIFEAHATKLRQSPSVQMYFITTASPDAVVDKKVSDRVDKVRSSIVSLGFVRDVAFDVWGSNEIYAAWQRKNNSNEVEIALEKQVNLPQMPGVDQAILGVVSVAELFKMVIDSSGQLDERVFYENVRGFKGVDNSVNERMMATLASPDRALLTVLNNGITVVAEAYAPKPGDAISLVGYQIVNGCQTTNCLYHSRDALGADLSNIYVPLKVVVTSDSEVAAQIILATNSQTAVQETELASLTEFQKQLEDYYEMDELEVHLTYERRAGQFYGKDVTKRRVVNINDQLRSVTAVALGQPHHAARYPSRLLAQVKDDVFRTGDQHLPYVAAAFASYRLENSFRTGLDSKFKPARYHMLMAFSFQTLGRAFQRLNSKGAVADAKKLIERLKTSEQVDVFSKAAEAVVGAAGGEMPSRDRLKRQQFTQELRDYLARDAQLAGD